MWECGRCQCGCCDLKPLWCCGSDILGVRASNAPLDDTSELQQPITSLYELLIWPLHIQCTFYSTAGTLRFSGSELVQVGTDKVRPVCVSGVVGNREIPKPTVGSAARVDNEVQRA